MSVNIEIGIPELVTAAKDIVIEVLKHKWEVQREELADKKVAIQELNAFSDMLRVLLAHLKAYGDLLKPHTDFIFVGFNLDLGVKKLASKVHLVFGDSKKPTSAAKIEGDATFLALHEDFDFLTFYFKCRHNLTGKFMYQILADAKVDNTDYLHDITVAKNFLTRLLNRSQSTGLPFYQSKVAEFIVESKLDVAELASHFDAHSRQIEHKAGSLAKAHLDYAMKSLPRTNRFRVTNKQVLATMRKKFEALPPQPDRKTFDSQLEEYYDFMDLAKSQPNNKLVPSVDLDSLIHTHLLHTSEYAKDCDAFFGYFLHHNPMEVNDELKVLWKQTKKLWFDKYSKALTGLISACYYTRGW